MTSGESLIDSNRIDSNLIDGNLIDSVQTELLKRIVNASSDQERRR